MVWYGVFQIIAMLRKEDPSGDFSAMHVRRYIYYVGGGVGMFVVWGVSYAVYIFKAG